MGDLIPVPCPPHLGGVHVECGRCEFIIHTVPPALCSKYHDLIKDAKEGKQDVTVYFQKEFATMPLVTYAVTSFTMSELEGPPSTGPHFNYDAKILEVTPAKATFELSTKVSLRVISATVTYWAMGTLKD